MSPPSSAKWPQKTMSLVTFTLKETLREKKGCWKAWTKRNVYMIIYVYNLYNTCFPQVTSYQFINTYLYIFCTYVTCPNVNKHLFNTTTIQYITTLTGINNWCTLHWNALCCFVWRLHSSVGISGRPKRPLGCRLLTVIDNKIHGFPEALITSYVGPCLNTGSQWIGKVKAGFLLKD